MLDNQPGAEGGDPTAYLLEISCKAMHVLVIGQECMGFSSIAVDIPDTQHGQQHRHVLLQGSSVEVIVLLHKHRRVKFGLQHLQHLGFPKNHNKMLMKPEVTWGNAAVVNFMF